MRARECDVWRLLLAALLMWLVAGCAAARPREPAGQRELRQRLDLSLDRAIRNMVEAQSPDGAWRSSVYGFMKDGPSLTPHLVSCLYFVPPGIGETEAEKGRVQRCFGRGVEYLVGLVDDAGRVRSDVELIYPVYTAAEASRMIGKGGTTPRFMRARDAWLRLLREHQLSDALGWRSTDREFGGWGFAVRPARRPAEGRERGPWDYSNLSATLYGVAALKSARVPCTDPSFGEALTFIQRCQNYSDGPQQGDSAWDDGGFFFAPATDLQNKAGGGTDRFGRKRYRSYGSMTADGLRGLLACGLPVEHPRVRAAREWLERHWSAQHNPGAFAATNEDLRDATYYYYCWSSAHAFLHLKRARAENQPQTQRWAVALAEALLAQQRGDGTWVNRFTDAREDDPLVATPFAAASLVICREFLGAAAEAK